MLGIHEMSMLCRSDKAVRPPSDIFTIVKGLGTGDR